MIFHDKGREANFVFTYPVEQVTVMENGPRL